MHSLAIAGRSWRSTAQKRHNDAAVLFTMFGGLVRAGAFGGVMASESTEFHRA